MPYDDTSDSSEVISGQYVNGAGLPFVKLIEHLEKLLGEGEPEIYRQVIKEVDRHVLCTVMKHFNGCQLHAARRLGMSRMTLRTKLRSLGVNYDGVQEGSCP